MLTEVIGIRIGTWVQSMFGLKFVFVRWTSPGTKSCSNESRVFTTPTSPAAFSVCPTQVLAAPMISGLEDECEEWKT